MFIDSSRCLNDDDVAYIALLKECAASLLSRAINIATPRGDELLWWVIERRTLRLSGSPTQLQMQLVGESAPSACWMHRLLRTARTFTSNCNCLNWPFSFDNFEARATLAKNASQLRNIPLSPDTQCLTRHDLGGLAGRAPQEIAAEYLGELLEGNVLLNPFTTALYHNRC